MLTGMPELVSAVSSQLRGKDIVSPWTVQISYGVAEAYSAPWLPQLGPKTVFAKLSCNEQIDGIAGKFVLAWTETDHGRARKLRVNFEDLDSARDVLVEQIKKHVEKWALSYVEVIETPQATNTTVTISDLSQIGLRVLPVVLSSRELMHKIKNIKERKWVNVGAAPYDAIDAGHVTRAIDIIGKAIDRATKIASSAGSLIHEQ